MPLAELFSWVMETLNDGACIIRHLQADAGTWWDSSKMAASRDPQVQMSQIQRQIQQDWANREYIEVITCSIKKIADFLNSFGKYIIWNW